MEFGTIGDMIPGPPSSLHYILIYPQILISWSPPFLALLRLTKEQLRITHFGSRGFGLPLLGFRPNSGTPHELIIRIELFKEPFTQP